MKFKERIAIVEGVRTPMGKMGTTLAVFEADDLGAIPVREVMLRAGFGPKDIDEVIIGNCAQPAHAANVARVIAIKAGIDKHVPAMTVHRNCASGMEAITTGANRITLGESKVVLAGGVESMSNIPFLYRKEMVVFFTNLMRSKTISQKLKTLLSFRLKNLVPIIGLEVGLIDPTCDLIMGKTAENLSRDFFVTRSEQDEFALRSHQLASAAILAGRLQEEIVPVVLPPKYSTTMVEDNGPRHDQSIESLARLKPYFDRKVGTVTVGTSSQVTDGAAAVILMKESQAKAEGREVLGYLKAYEYAGLDPARMGLGPVYATSKLLDSCKMSLADMELVEINEAFAAQVIGCLRAFESKAFSQEFLGKKDKLGSIDMRRLNVNGGALALGHPLGMTGTRLVITLLKEMRRKKKQTGLATLCIGGGQGAALLLEAN
ncbi:MAG: thiolase family protein [bacterium]|nr:thiolase family protein [bacterium]